MPLQTGQVLQNRYHIIRPLGKGGMGTVYLAQDNRLGNFVAIKELNPASLPMQDRPWAVNAFEQEAKLLAKLRHPALSAVTDYFAEQYLLFLVMEYIEGETLEQVWLHQPGHRFAPQQVVAWARQLCNVLSYLHSQNPPIIFRDLKPGNIMVLSDGRLKLIDFGIARYFKPGQTRDTIALGTVGYAAPEQHGQGQVDARSDIYALGAVLHQLLTGYDPTTTPFNLPPIPSLAPNVPFQVTQAVERALVLDRLQRPISAQAFCDLLQLQERAFPNRAWSLMAVLVTIVGVGLGIRAIRGGINPTLDPTRVIVTDTQAIPTSTPLPSSPTSETLIVTPGMIVVTVTVAVTTEPIETELAAEETPVSPIMPTVMCTPPACGANEAYFCIGDCPGGCGTVCATTTPMPADEPYGRIAFVSDRGGLDSIYVMDVREPQSVLPITQAIGYDWWPTWCGDNLIAFERANRSSDENVEPDWMEIFLVNISDGNIRQLSSSSMPAESAMNGHPGCSRDGRYLAFSSLAANARSNEYRIGWIDLEDRSSRFNIIGDGYALSGNVSWSPENQNIIFMHFDGEVFHIYRVSLTQDDVYFELSADDSNKYPAWSPVGNQVAFVCIHSRGNERIWSLCLTPAEPSQVTETEELQELYIGPERPQEGFRVRHPGTPSWSPDARWIAYASNQDGDWDIYIYNMNTHDIRNLTHNDSSDEFHPAWGGE